MTRKIIACEVMKEELLTIPVQGDVEFEFVSMGLHSYPDKLKIELQKLIDKNFDYEMIILGFGLCGQAVENIKAGSCPIIIPRVHDCIPLLIGSCKRYEEVKAEAPGTFYLSGGWTEGERSILNEHQRTYEKYGEKRANKVLKMMFDSYNRLMFINTNHPRVEKAKDLSKETAKVTNLEYQEMDGNNVYLDKLVNGPWESNEFIKVKPCEKIVNKEFLGFI